MTNWMDRSLVGMLLVLTGISMVLLGSLMV